MITINFEKAREITRERLRRERKPLLEEQDILFMRAVENSQDKSEIVAEKQRLRDITQLADSATTLDDLKELTARYPK
jgi:RIO-like serine/threonine protein kinase